MDDNPIPPEHRFNVKREEWEYAVFRNADRFVVHRRYGRFNHEKREFETLPEAFKDIEGDPRAMLYAVTATGRNVLLPRDQWAAFETDWNERHGEKQPFETLDHHYESGPYGVCRRCGGEKGRAHLKGTKR